MAFTWQDIPNHFSFADVYDEMVLKAPSPAVFVEIGTWMGASAAYMAGKIRDSGKQIHFFAMDNFTAKGSGRILEQQVADMGGSFYRLFCENIRRCRVEGYVEPIIADSSAGARRFADQSVDFVYIDACHEYRKVKKDILAWLPRVKAGGTIAGHDYNDGHPGVRRAVHEIFHDCRIRVQRSSWMVELVDQEMDYVNRLIEARRQRWERSRRTMAEPEHGS